MKALLALACLAPATMFGAWAPFDDFEAYSTGALNGNGGWVADANWTITAAPLGGTGRAASGLTSAANARAYKPLPLAIADASTAATIFFRFYRSGGINLSIGLSDDAVPVAFTGFESQINAQHTASPDTMKVRDGGAFDDLGPNTFQNETWYNVWMVVNNAANSFQVWIDTGAQAPAFASNHVLDPVGGAPGDFDFGFRNGAAANPLTTFVAIMGGDTVTGRFYMDDIYVDTSAQNLSSPTIPEPASAIFVIGGTAMLICRRLRPGSAV
jgi:hypothetical protein